MEYGTVSSRELKGVKGGLARGLLTQRGRGGITAAGKRGSKGKGVGMSWKESLISEGDRVAILSDTGPERRDKWKIGTVMSVREKEREVLVKGLNKVRAFTWCRLFRIRIGHGYRRLLLAAAAWVWCDDVSSALTSTYDESSYLTISL